MRHHLFLVFFVLLSNALAQDPDQNPYFTRYTIVEDSDQLTPLAGTYVVHYIQRGTYWTYMDAMEPILGLPEKGMRLQPVFGAGYPALLATPARGIDKPDAQLVVLRGQDTMFVDLRSYYPGMGSLVNDRCERMECTRRPPVVLPFRKGRYHPDGVVLGYHMDRASDPRTDALTGQFDALWKKAMKEESVVPQLNSDTCRQELVLPPDVEPNRTPMRDAWLMRSPYCGTHLVLFPSLGMVTDYTITFVPFLPDEKKEPMHIHVPLGDHTDGLVDVSAWPVGDHNVSLMAGSNSGTFTLKLR